MENTENPLQLLQQRHSVRAYSTEPIDTALLNKLKAEVTMINTHQHGLKFKIVTDDPDPFKSFSRSYGNFTNPHNYLAAVVDAAVDNVIERAGYFAEQFAIKATSLGLGTCFVGATFSEVKVKVQLRAGEKVLFVVIFGYPLGKEKFLAKLTAKVAHLKKMTSDDFFVPKEKLGEALTLFPMLQTGLEAIACAPSWMNGRPTRVKLDGEGENARPCAYVDDKDPKRLIDLGIAKFNFNFATATECEWGNGAPLVV